ncbi:SMI1/KNR4 family protein [Paenibacillus sp. SI8]|uniref:SMI1/KNR4 family protein n=1 Tax=unclassified Paenibacillus TaxID=185978 RepID=UPI003465B589
MDLIIENSFPAITSDHLDAVEKRYGIKLPEDYKQFLLKQNGGSPSISKFSTKDGKVTSFSMNFLPLIDKGPSLVANYLVFNRDGKLPSNIIAIGEDPIKNLVCISVDGSDRGSIYYWDFLHDEEIKPSYNYLLRISDSFTDFIEGLQPD